MPRPKSPIRKVELHVLLPQELMARLRLKLYSNLTVCGVKFGSLSKFVEEAIEEKLARLKQDE